TSASIPSRSLAGVVGTESVTLTGGTATFDTKNAGPNKDVSGTGFALGGTDKGNYTLASSALTTKATIIAESVSGRCAAADKVYDGATDASITGRSVSGVVGTEDVSLTGGSASFGTKDVGTGKTVSGTGFALGGADKGNYVLGAVADATASV